MKKIVQYFKKIFNPKCSHNAAKRGNCKFCPDCGEKILLKWVTIRCECCGHYRKPSNDWLGNIKPVKKYCFYCGSSGWTSQNYYDFSIPEKMKSISIKKIEVENDCKFGTLTGKTKVWISRPPN